MRRTSVSHMQVKRPDGTRRRIKVVRQALPPVVMPVKKATRVMSGGHRRVVARPLAREVAELLRNEPLKFPEDLRSDM